MIWAKLAVALCLLGASAPAQVRASELGLRVDALAVALPSGDAADVYVPDVQPFRDLFQNAFPVVVFLQGGLTDKAFYGELARQVAARGYVVYVPNHLKLLGPAPALFADGSSLQDVLAAASAADADPASPLYQIVDTARMGVSGHSFGGVAAVYAATASCPPPFCTPPSPVYQRPAALRAVAVYGVTTVQGPLTLEVANDLPTALIGGSQDTRVPPANVVATYDVLEPTRAMILIDGANHWGVADVQNPPGAQPEAGPQALAQAQSIRVIAARTALFFDAFVRGSSLAKLLIELELSGPGVRVTSDLR